ncbi:MAG: STAS domain-containing protein [Acidimicrobiia bacterium]|nr:STAS domain-containing protein [Acidimicrobiia bacterium]
MYTTDAVRLSEYEAFTVAHLEGEIDLSNAIEIETELTYAVPDEAEGLIIDLSDVSSIDSTGLRCLFDLADRLGRRQQELRLVVDEGSNLFRTLTLVHLSAVAPMFEDVEAAADVDLLSSGVEPREHR